jgi:hypothetical protein
MGILGTFKNMFAGQAKAATEAAPEPVRIDTNLAPGSRVHHEYFVGDASDADSKWAWHARVYADNGAVNEERGRADSRELARNAALTWCARVKAQLGGEA